MSRFCPYCGKQLSERSKFCPQCGKASAPRRRQTGVVVEDDRARTTRPMVESNESAAPDPGRYISPSRTAESLAAAQADPLPRAPNMGAQGQPRNGSTAAIRDGIRRFAPKTGSLVGPHEQAGFGLRYGAWMFDFLIILIAIMGFTFAVTAVSRRSVVGSNSDLLIVSGLTLLLFLANFVVLAGMNGQSLGMRILGIYIVRVDGKPFTIKDAALRHVVGYPLSMAVAFLGFLWMLWDPRQQGWHDKLARTIVVMSK